MNFIAYTIKRVIILALLASLIYMIWWYATPWLNQPIRDVLVTGEGVPQLVREDLKQRLLEKQLDRYFTVDINTVKQVAKDNVWVDDARVSRVWPDRLVIDVLPPIFVARWGEQAFLNHHWQVADVESQWVPAADKLPQLIGPPAQSAQIAELFTVMSAILAQEKLAIDTFSMADRGAIDVTLDNQIKLLLGREKVQSRLQRIVALYGSDLMHNKTDIISIDGRYDHGIAVTMK